MLAVVASVILTILVIEILLKLRQIVVWTAVSALFAIVLHPPVDLLVKKLKMARALAALLVFLTGTVVVAGLGYAFVRPLADQITVAVNEVPGYVADAQSGRGTIGHLVKKYNIDTWVQKNQPKLQSALKSAEKPLVKVATGLLNTLTAAATIIVMTFLLLIEGPRMMEGGLAVLSPPTRRPVEAVLRDLVRAVAGYMGGVLTSSIIAGLVSYIALWALGIPFRGVLALWIGFTTLIPLVGIFVGVIPAAVVGFIHSTPAGFAIIVIVLGFSLIENRTLGKLINARTIDLSPLAVAVSVIAGLQLLGFLGVFLAIPVAGAIHVVVRDVWFLRHPSTAPAPAPAAAAVVAGDAAAVGS